MTYRSRLLLYVGMLLVLLVGMMTLSFKAAEDVIVAGTNEHLRHVALRKEAGVKAQIQELEHYTEVIASDLRLQDYLYTILERGAGAEGLRTYYDRQFASLLTDWRLIISSQGEVLLGKEYPRLIDALGRRRAVTESEYFFFDTPQGVVMAAARPVLYQGQQLATTVVGRVLDQSWLNKQEDRSRDYLLFFEQHGRVLRSSNAQYQDLPIDTRRQSLDYGDDHFRLRRVSYAQPHAGLPGLWFGVAESNLNQLLASYQRWVYSFAALGSVAALFVGWLVLRNFSKPMEALMLTTEKMIDGELPVMARSDASTEMDKLVNRFADVLDALRREQSKLERANRKLQETAITDSLTGLYNRRYLLEVTPGLFAQIVRDRRYLTAVLLDLDYFKAINDSWGHLGGDAVLVHFARLLKHNSRANDFLFRIGGEEFMLLNVTEDPRDSVALANKIRALVQSSPANYQGTTVQITVSAGVSCCYGESGDISLSTLMRAADKALYEAKSAGRNRVILHSSCLDATRTATRRAHMALVEGGAREKPDL
jgi:diguanylate cyclase (GGDEF)-like protein